MTNPNLPWSWGLDEDEATAYAAECYARLDDMLENDYRGSWNVQARGAGEATWSPNGLYFARARDANEYTAGLWMRWYGCDAVRVAWSPEEPNR